MIKNHQKYFRLILSLFLVLALVLTIQVQQVSAAAPRIMFENRREYRRYCKSYGKSEL